MENRNNTTEAILILHSTNDERDGDGKYLVNPPLTLMGERLLWYCFNVFYQKMKNGEISRKGSFKGTDFLLFMKLNKGNLTALKNELKSSTGISSSQMILKSNKDNSIIISNPIFENIYWGRAHVHFEFKKEYLDRVTVPIVNRYSTTTQKEVQGFTKVSSFKLAKWVKDRTSILLNAKHITSEITEKAQEIRKKIENMNLEESIEYIKQLNPNSNYDFSKSKTKERLIDKFLGVDKMKRQLSLKFELNEIREIIYGSNKNDWGYYQNNPQQKDWEKNKKAAENFLLAQIKPAITQINEYSLFNVTYPVFQEEDKSDPFNKTVKILVDEKTGIFGSEEWKYSMELTNNLKIALINGIKKTGKVELPDNHRIDYNAGTLKLVKEIKSLKELEHEGIMARIATAEQQLEITKKNDAPQQIQQPLESMLIPPPIFDAEESEDDLTKKMEDVPIF